MSVFVVSLVATVAASIVAGVILSRLLGRSDREAALRRAYQEGKASGLEQAEVEKAQLSQRLGGELFKIRESILRSAEAYDSAVQAVEQTLSVSAQAVPKRLSASDEDERQLHLEFERSQRGASPSGAEEEGDHAEDSGVEDSALEDSALEDGEAADDEQSTLRLRSAAMQEAVERADEAPAGEVAAEEAASEEMQQAKRVNE